MELMPAALDEFPVAFSTSPGKAGEAVADVRSTSDMMNELQISEMRKHDGILIESEIGDGYPTAESKV